MRVMMRQIGFAGRLFSRRRGLFLILLAALPACDRSGSLPASLPTEAPVAVTVALAERERSAPPVPVAGVIEPRRRATPAARLTATVIAAPFEEGDRVTTGQLLVRLDTRDLAAQRAQALAAIAEAEAERAGAETDLQRVQTLAARQVVARARLDSARTAHARAAAAVQSAEAALREIEVMLDYGTVGAPFAGRIVRKMVEVGDLATPGQPLFAIEDDAQVRIVASIGEDQALRLATGERLAVEVARQDMSRTKSVSGVVEAVLPSADTSRPGFRLHLLVDSPDHRLQSDMSVVVHLPSAAPTADSVVVRVPAEAIVTRGQLSAVVVVDDAGTAGLRWVKVLTLTDGEARLTEGLQGGERVVLGPAARELRDKQPVILAADRI